MTAYHYHNVTESSRPIDETGRMKEIRRPLAGDLSQISITFTTLQARPAQSASEPTGTA
jgi:hypothetical protein